MTSEAFSRPTPNRRNFLGAALATGVVLVAGSAPTVAHAAAGDVTLTGGGISLLASVGGRLAIRDAAGVTRSAGSKFQVKDSATGIHVSTGGTPTLSALADGTPAIRMDYTFDSAAGATTVTGWFSVGTSHAVLEWRVTGADTLVPDGFLFSRAIQAPTAPDDYVAITEWVRDAGGGIPYEDTLGVAHTSTWGSALHGLFLLDRSRQAWTNATWIHSPGVVDPAGGWTSRADFFFSETRPSATATIGTGRELGLELTTDSDFNLYDSPGEPMALTALVANGGSTAKSVELALWARDFDGTQLAATTVTGSVPAAGTWQHTFTLTAPAAGIALAEVVVGSGDDEAFARTNLAVLPPYDYQAGADSMFGIANYPWLQRPSADALLDLWQKVGIGLVRIAYDGGPGLPPSAFDARGMRHNIELQPSLTVSDTQAATWAADNLAVAAGAGAGYFEVGNELNRPFNTGTAAQAYLDKALRPVFDRRAVTGDTVKLMNNGLAGMDKPWVENFVAAGGWDLIDAFAYHPGRGNFTPDYIPPGDTWTTDGDGTYWNFYGGLRQLKTLMAAHGAKEIWLTEAYAPTKPNSWWHDTYRHAAENVLLTLALAKAEGVRCVCWYQFHDSVLGMPQVADPDNVEYHYGLMNRDLSPKPSLLAYATAARTLDQATFQGWLTFPDPKTFGLWFDTPDGPAVVLWNRADGYLLNTQGQRADWHFPAPEMWTDPWPTKTPLVAAASAPVKEVDAVGRSRQLPVTGGSVTLTLDGAPRIYHGLTPSTDSQGRHTLTTGPAQ
ncbi:twin-arginine translocation signal domain-containing protein [Streptomyces sp. SID13726]|uniref:twin-arginine translocation signal domain-containing protein n=1 Tax=Streptomyces sp. SID13726 TaxID=2706058 RepID=UPI0013B79E6E|nr:twin-arginine translocation signal domain-containing protein [Streptomyces sp. SID13726]NEB02584.1 twin-arginine translocation signal domain-containing protein [Streptomyces sp. SID13726]